MIEIAPIGVVAIEPHPMGMGLPSASRIRTWVVARAGRLWSQLAPQMSASELVGAAVDAMRSRRELVIENAVLGHQLNVLGRRSKRPRLQLMDRIKLLVGARLLSSWRRAIVVVQPETVLRWHRAGFRLFWRRRSRPRKASPLPSETIDLIREMAVRGRLWGAPRSPASTRFPAARKARSLRQGGRREAALPELKRGGLASSPGAGHA